MPGRRLNLVIAAIRKKVKNGPVFRWQRDVEMECVQLLKVPAAAGSDFAERYKLLGDGKFGYGRHIYTPDPVATSSSLALRLSPKLSSVRLVG